MTSIHKMTSLSTLLTYILATLISIGLPAGYFLLGYQNQRAVIQTEAYMNSIFLSEAISESPEYWRYEEHRLSEVLAFHTSRRYNELRRVVDADNTVVAQAGKTIAPPFLTASHNLYDSGRVVGRIEITTSLRPLLINTLFTAVLGLFFGMLVFAALKYFPLHALSTALQAVYEEKEKLRSLTSIAQDAIVMMDHEGNISFWNPAAEKIFGYSSSEALGKEMHTFLAPQRYYEDYRKGLLHFRETGQGSAVGKTLELDAIRKGGEEFPVELSLSALQIEGKWHAVGIMRDITERKRIADEVRKLNEELELKITERTKQLLDAREELVRKEKLSILGQLAGSVGHELRNPLGVMNNAIYFLKTVLPESDETVREYLNMIKSEIDNSERIISDLLDFSRTKTPQIKSIPVSELLSTSLGKCFVPENVNIETTIPDTLPLLKVDPFQMVQVFQNLITNACQAMPKGGELRISARKGTRDLGLGVSAKEPIPIPQSPNPVNCPQPPIPDREFIEISVTDTGEGISPENMNKIFQPLFTTKAAGIGLGLVVSKKLAEANGGSIDIESSSGKGTTFTVMLPAEGKGV